MGVLACVFQATIRPVHSGGPDGSIALHVRRAAVIRVMSEVSQPSNMPAVACCYPISSPIVFCRGVPSKPCRSPIVCFPRSKPCRSCGEHPFPFRGQLIPIAPSGRGDPLMRSPVPPDPSRPSFIRPLPAAGFAPLAAGQRIAPAFAATSVAAPATALVRHGFVIGWRFQPFVHPFLAADPAPLEAGQLKYVAASAAMIQSVGWCFRTLRHGSLSGRGAPPGRDGACAKPCSLQ